jgi:mono/diheme cytochrome c family protein
MPRVVAGIAIAMGLAACADREPGLPPADTSPRVVAASDIEAGRYLVLVGGCNDCHTPNWPETDGGVAEAERLVGSDRGFKGPWGVSYPTNLRLLAQNVTEDAWVKMLRDGKSLQPMPTQNIKRMHEADLRAMFRYVYGLGAAGAPEPDNLPPGAAPRP